MKLTKANTELENEIYTKDNLITLIPKVIQKCVMPLLLHFLIQELHKQLCTQNFK